MDDSRTKTPPVVPTESAREGGDGRLVPSREGGDGRLVAEGDGGFLGRWSRLKREARERPADPLPAATAEPATPPPDLPPTDALTFDSDYRQFFHPKVGEDVRRAALKKLFSDPRFNVMDGLDVYIDDYSKTEPIPAAMLAGLKQAQNILRWAKEDADERQRKEAAAENAPQATDTERAPLESLEAQPDSGVGLEMKAPQAAEPAPVSTSDPAAPARS